MLPRDRSKKGCPAISARQLLIRYPSSRVASKPQRKLIYVCRGIPPVTSAEVAIMHEHLEQSAKGALARGSNDNM